MSEVSIIPSITSVQMTSTLQNVSISINNASVVVSLASGEYLPTDPTFNSLTVTNSANIGHDLDVARDVNAGRDVNAVNNMTVGETFNCKEFHCAETSYLNDAVIYGDITTVNSIQFDTTPTDIPTNVGTMYYDNTDNVISVVLPNGVTAQLPEEVFFNVRNATENTMLDGKLVYISGEAGNRSTVEYASNTTCATASRCIAMLTQDIAPNATGKATFLGLVRDRNTQGLTGGPELWLGTNGDYTTTIPPVGTARVRIGRVAKEHPTDGHILIVIQQDKYMFGDRDNGNYSVFEDSGFIAHYNNARPWEDLNFDVLNSGGPAANVPDNVRIGNNDYREFTSNNNQSCSANKENFHAAQLGQTFTPHVHIFLKSGETIGTTGVTFTIYWELRQSTGITNGSIILSATSAQLQANPYKVDLYNGGSFAGPTELGAQLNLRLARTGGNAGDVIATTYGVHVALDSGGSRTATSK